MEHTRRPNKPPWSLRQFALCQKHQTLGLSWILVGAYPRPEDCFNEYAKGTAVKERNPFELHVIFIDVAIASWRPYLIHLEELWIEFSDKASLTTMESKQPLRNHYRVQAQDYTDLKELEDHVTNVTLCLDSTLDTLTALLNFYQKYRPGNEGSPHKAASSSDLVSFALQQHQRHVIYSRKKAEALLAKSRNTRKLILSLLDHMAWNSLDQQILVLQNLEQQGQEENGIIRQLMEKSSQDSASVRILTILTLVYLPCTAVSSFYSTQFVDQIQVDSGYNLVYAQNASPFFAISVPLTLFTITLWYTWANSRRLHQAIVTKRDDQKEKLQGYLNALKSPRKIPRLPC